MSGAFTRRKALKGFAGLGVGGIASDAAAKLGLGSTPKLPGAFTASGLKNAPGKIDLVQHFTPAQREMSQVLDTLLSSRNQRTEERNSHVRLSPEIECLRSISPAMKLHLQRTKDAELDDVINEIQKKLYGSG